MIKGEIMIRDYRDEDAESLMLMWRETAQLWPMGSPHPTELSEQEFNQRMKETGTFKDWIAWDSSLNRVVGFCAFSRDTVIPEHMEVSLVNMHPDWQGRGIGKALLIKCIEETVKMGSPALFLGTWPGNEVACGLYKRLGFFHKPESDIGFVNYIPTVLQCSALNKFINTSNWYSSLKRDTSYGPDKHTDGKMKVYPYLFETEAGKVEAGFELNSNGLYRLETPEIKLSLTTDYDKAWKGFSREIYIAVKSQTGTLPGFQANFTGKNGLLYEKTIEPDDAISELNEKFDVEIPENLSLEQKESPSVQAMIKWENMAPFNLNCGYEPVEPLAAAFTEMNAFVPAGAGARRILNIKNNLDRKVTAEFKLTCPGNQTVTPTSFDLILDSGRTKGIELTIDGSPGSFEFMCKSKIVSGKQGKIPDQKIKAGLVSPEKPAVIENIHNIFVANTNYYFLLNKNMGLMRVKPCFDRQSTLGLVPISAGPPYPNYGLDGEAKYQVTEKGNEIEIRMEIPSRQFKSTKYVQIFKLSSSPMIAVDAWIESKGLTGKGLKLRQRVTETSFHRTTVVPVDHDAYRIYSIGNDNSLDNLPQGKLLNEESWLAMEGRNAVVGCIWTNKQKNMEIGSYYAATVSKALDELSPDNPIKLDRLWYYAGPGNTGTIRDIWRQFHDLESEHLPVRRVASDSRKAVVLTSGDDSLTVNLETMIKKPGVLSVITDDIPALGIKKQKQRVSGVSSETPREIKIEVNQRNVQAGIELLTGKIAAAQWDESLKLPVIVTARGKVKHTKSKKGKYLVHTLQSGSTKVEIAPGYPGQVISMCLDGRETLHSQFPGSGVLGFEKPYYGGITPTVQVDYHSEIFYMKGRADPADYTDQFGLKWQGIKVKSRINNQTGLQDSILTCRYLLSPQLPVLKAIIELDNLSDCQVRSMLMSIISPVMPPFESTLTASFKQAGKLIGYRRGRIGESLLFDNWLDLDYGDSIPGFHLAVIDRNTCHGDTIDTGQGQLYCYAVNSDCLKPDANQRLELMIGSGKTGEGLKYLV